MVNFNGNLLEEEKVLSFNNRGYNYGDAVFETIKVVSGKLLFWEDHYFRLMSSMRILRMQIPMNFTMEFFENEILKTLTSNKLTNLTSRVKLVVNRKQGGLYTPNNNDVDYLISAIEFQDASYSYNDFNYVVDLFKDHYISSSLISTIKTTNKAIHVVGSIFAKENDLQNCLLLNTNKHVIEALNGNVFLVNGNKIKTPPILDGCLNGVMRKQLIKILKESEVLEVEEASISPFELQKADEIFITNVITGIQPISKYRKKIYTNEVSKALIEKLNAIID